MDKFRHHLEFRIFDISWRKFYKYIIAWVMRIKRLKYLLRFFNMDLVIGIKIKLKSNWISSEMSQNFQLDCQVQLPGATWTSKTENWVFPIKYDSYQIIQSIQSVQSLALSIRPFYCHIIRGHTVHDIRIDRHFFGLHFPWRIYFVSKKWSSSGLFYGRICWGYLLNPLNLELEF